MDGRANQSAQRTEVDGHVMGLKLRMRAPPIGRRLEPENLWFDYYPRLIVSPTTPLKKDELNFIDSVQLLLNGQERFQITLN